MCFLHTFSKSWISNSYTSICNWLYTQVKCFATPGQQLNCLEQQHHLVISTVNGLTMYFLIIFFYPLKTRNIHSLPLSGCSSNWVNSTLTLSHSLSLTPFPFSYLFHLFFSSRIWLSSPNKKICQFRSPSLRALTFLFIPTHLFVP